MLKMNLKKSDLKIVKKNKIMDFFDEHFADIICGIVLIAIAVFVAVLICGAVRNEQNAIDRGIIIDKEYHAATNTVTYVHVNGEAIPQSRYVPAKYMFTIKGNKNGNAVEYTFEVPENEYEQYKVGDYYKK